MNHAAALHVESFAGITPQTILFLHGGGVAGWMWHPLIESLGDTRTCLVPDLPGHGQSVDHAYQSHQHTVDALISLLESEATTPVTVIGFSLGAQLAVLLASQRPDLVERIVVISAQAKPSRWPAATLALLSAAAPLAKNERFARAQAKELFIPSDLFPAYLRTSQSISRETLLASVGENLRFAVPRAWTTFPGEALVLVGGKERQLMKTSSELLVRARPSSTSQIVDGCGHGIPLQKPEWLADRLDAWLV